MNQVTPKGVFMDTEEQLWWSREIRYVRESVDVLKDEVGKIKEKVYDGYSESLQSLREVVRDLAATQKELADMQHEQEMRIKGCEDKDKALAADESRGWKRRTYIVSLLLLLATIGGVIGVFI